jgi:hypothetical protein
MAELLWWILSHSVLTWLDIKTVGCLDTASTATTLRIALIGSYQITSLEYHQQQQLTVHSNEFQKSFELWVLTNFNVVFDCNSVCVLEIQFRVRENTMNINDDDSDLCTEYSLRTCQTDSVHDSGFEIAYDDVDNLHHLTDERIAATLLKRSTTNLHSELLYLIDSLQKLADKLECSKDLLNEELLYQSATAQMCSAAMEASQMTLTAASRFSSFVNHLLLSSFDANTPNCAASLIIASTSFNSKYIGIGLTEKWYANEDKILIDLVKSNIGRKLDLVAISFELRYCYFVSEKLNQNCKVYL